MTPVRGQGVGMRYRRLVAVAGALALGLTACGGGASPSERAAQQEKQKEKTAPAAPKGAGFQVVQDAAAKGPAKDLAGAQKGGTVTILTAAAPETFDPTRSYYIDTGS